MNKKGEMSTRDWVVAVLIFGAVISLLYLQVGELERNYDVTNITDEKFNESFNNFEEQRAFADEMWDKTTAKEGLSVTGTLSLLWGSTTGVIQLVFSSVSSIGSQVKEFANYFGVPTVVTGTFFALLTTILFVYIVFRVLSSLTQREL